MNKDLLMLKQKLPHGAIKEIAIRTNLSSATISQVLNGHTVSPKQILIIRSICEYLKENKKKEEEVNQALQEALSQDPELLGNRLKSQQEKYGEGTSPLL